MTKFEYSLKFEVGAGKLAILFVQQEQDETTPAASFRRAPPSMWLHFRRMVLAVCRNGGVQADLCESVDDPANVRGGRCGSVVRDKSVADVPALVVTGMVCWLIVALDPALIRLAFK